MSKLRFFSPKHKETNTYNGMFIAETAEQAKEIALANKFFKKEDIDKYIFEDITLEITQRDKIINNIK